MKSKQTVIRSVGSSPWRHGLILIPLIFACLAATSALTMADNREQSFDGTVSGTIPPQSQWVPDPHNPCLFTIMLTPGGTSNLLGDFHGTATFVPNVCDGSYTGSYEFISANGRDSISGPFRGQLIPTATAGVSTNFETATITGGNGRFKHASGMYTLYGVIDFNASTFVLPWLGTLSADGH